MSVDGMEAALTSDLPVGIRSVLVGGEVFLKSRFVELGVHSAGSFGTA
jgi:hypothetical protein